MAGPSDRPPTAREIARSLRTLQEAGRELGAEAFRIWTYLVDENVGVLKWGISDLAKRFRISRTTMYRSLRKLKDAGYVDYDEGGRFKRTVIHLRIAMISQANNHIYKTGVTAFTIPDQTPAPLKAAPVLTIIRRDESDPTHRPKSAPDPDSSSTNLTPDRSNSRSKSDRSTEHLSCTGSATRGSGHDLNQPNLEPIVQPAEIVDKKDPSCSTSDNVEPDSVKNGSRQYSIPISSSLSENDQDKDLPDLASFTLVQHDKCSVPTAVNKSGTPPAVDAIPPTGLDLPLVPLSPAAGASPPEEVSSSHTEEDVAPAEASGSPAAVRSRVNVVKLKARRSPVAREAAKRSRLGAVAPVPPDIKRNPLPVPEVVYGFTLNGDPRDVLLRHLARGYRSKDRITTVYALGNLAREQYLVWRRKRLGDSAFKFHEDGDEKLWQKLGVACFQRGMRPVQVFNFWAKPENNFTRLNHPHKRISFICAIPQIDAANDEAGSKRPRGAMAPPVPVDAMHAYDSKKLHPELRQVLEEAGHDVSGKTDRDLMTTQMVAKDFAKGRMHVFAPAPIPERAKLVMHLFKESDDAD